VQSSGNTFFEISYFVEQYIFSSSSIIEEAYNTNSSLAARIRVKTMAVLQCVAVRSNVLQYVAVRFSHIRVWHEIGGKIFGIETGIS